MGLFSWDASDFFFFRGALKIRTTRLGPASCKKEKSRFELVAQLMQESYDLGAKLASLDVFGRTG